MSSLFYGSGPGQSFFTNRASTNRASYQASGLERESRYRSNVSEESMRRIYNYNGEALLPSTLASWMLNPQSRMTDALRFLNRFCQSEPNVDNKIKMLDSLVNIIQRLDHFQLSNENVMNLRSILENISPHLLSEKRQLHDPDLMSPQRREFNYKALHYANLIDAIANHTSVSPDDKFRHGLSGPVHAMFLITEGNPQEVTPLLAIQSVARLLYDDSSYPERRAEVENNWKLLDQTMLCHLIFKFPYDGDSAAYYRSCTNFDNYINLVRLLSFDEDRGSSFQHCIENMRQLQHPEMRRLEQRGVFNLGQAVVDEPVRNSNPPINTDMPIRNEHGLQFKSTRSESQNESFSNTVRQAIENREIAKGFKVSDMSIFNPDALPWECVIMQDADTSSIPLMVAASGHTYSSEGLIGHFENAGTGSTFTYNGQLYVNASELTAGDPLTRDPIYLQGDFDHQIVPNMTLHLLNVASTEGASEDDKKRALKALTCPLTGQLLRDPVMIVQTGIMVSKAALETHWSGQGPGQRTCPVTGTLLNDSQSTFPGVTNVDSSLKNAVELLEAARRTRMDGKQSVINQFEDGELADDFSPQAKIIFRYAKGEVGLFEDMSLEDMIRRSVEPFDDSNIVHNMMKLHSAFVAMKDTVPKGIYDQCLSELDRQLSAVLKESIYSPGEKAMLLANYLYIDYSITNESKTSISDRLEIFRAGNLPRGVLMDAQRYVEAMSQIQFWPTSSDMATILPELPSESLSQFLLTQTAIAGGMDGATALIHVLSTSMRPEDDIPDQLLGVYQLKKFVDSNHLKFPFAQMLKINQGITTAIEKLKTRLCDISTEDELDAVIDRLLDMQSKWKIDISHLLYPDELPINDPQLAHWKLVCLDRIHPRPEYWV